MNEIPLPKYAASERLSFESALRALFDVDQYDDWVNDAVYYRDQRERLDDCVEQQKSIWAGGNLPPAQTIEFTIPREKGEPCPSTIFPLSHRVAAYCVAGSMAPRLEKHAVRDRVHGFEFKPNGNPALFSNPADGITEVWDGAVAVVDHNDYLQLVDVDAFNASCQPKLLLKALQSCGARADELLFLRGLIGQVDVGLPSIDDAFAYLYNYYLQPVDRRLKKAKVSFLRHRDMYFLFDENAIEPVMEGIKDRKLTAREMVDDPELRDFVYSEADLPSFEDLDLEDLELPSQTDPLVWLELPNARIKVVFNLEWTGEAELMDVELSDIDAAEQSLKSTEAFVDYTDRPFHQLDGVSLQPLFRRIHPIRSTAVTKLPQFDGASQAFFEYREKLAPAKARLLTTVLAAAKPYSKSPWHATWASALLSDLGPLTADAAQSTLELLATTTPLVQPHLRLLLARCSDLPPEKIWKDPPASTTSFELRSALMCASYLARRGHNAAWMAWRERAQDREPLLADFLEKNLKADKEGR